MDGLLSGVESKQAVENVVALCLTERLNQGVVQVTVFAQLQVKCLYVMYINT